MNKKCKICGDDPNVTSICGGCYGNHTHLELEKEKAREEGKNEMAQECYKEVRSLGNRIYPLKDLYEKEIKELILKGFRRRFKNRFDSIFIDLDEIERIINKS